MATMTFDTKIAVVLRRDLPTWQKLNVTAFTVSGIAATVPDVTGDPYEDGSGNQYLPMFKQPVLVFEADHEQIQQVYERAMALEIPFAIFTEELFTTGNDIDNRAAVKAIPRDGLNVVGIALRDSKKRVDKVVKGISLHK
jgi:hypothetical protein